MKATRTILASLLLATACGDVTQPAPDTDGTGDVGPGPIDGVDPGAGDGDGSGSNPPPPPELPFLTEAPKAAHTPSSLFGVAFSVAEIADMIGETAPEARYDLVEQRIVTTTAEPISVTISVSAPAGTFSRTLATDVTLNSPTPVGPTVLCADALYTYDLPECSTSPRPRGTTPESGAISHARYQLSLVSEATGAKVAGCITNGPLSITCALPAGAGAAYKIMLSGNGFSDLWNGFPGLGVVELDGKRFTGVLQDLEFQCDPSLYEIENLREYCYAHWVFNRYTGIDAVTLAFDPASITISAAGATKQFASPAMEWGPGDDDLPGPNY